MREITALERNELARWPGYALLTTLKVAAYLTVKEIKAGLEMSVATTRVCYPIYRVALRDVDVVSCTIYFLCVMLLI